jgi:hypothetical protein
MKRVITLLILTIFLVLIGTSEASAQNITTNSLIITTGEATSTPQENIKLTLTTDAGIDLSGSLINWYLNGNKVIKQGIGLTELSVPVEYDTINITAMIVVNNTDGSTTIHKGELELTPELQSETVTKSDKLVGVDTVDIGCDDYKIVTNPSRPRMFQRVVYTFTKRDGTSIDDQTIKWTFNDKVVSEELGQTVYVIRSASPNKTIKIRAEIPFVPGACAEKTLIPGDDPRLKFRDSKATRIAECASESLRLMQRDYDIINRRVDQFKVKYESSKENITKDIAFLQDLILRLPADSAKTISELVETATTLGASRPGQPILIRLAKQFTEFGELILSNDISARVVYIQNQINYYYRLIDWLNATQYSIQAESDSMIKRLDKQKNKCIEIANEKSELADLVNIGTVRDYRKYEW